MQTFVSKQPPPQTHDIVLPTAPGLKSDSEESDPMSTELTPVFELKPRHLKQALCNTHSKKSAENHGCSPTGKTAVD